MNSRLRSKCMTLYSCSQWRSQAMAECGSCHTTLNNTVGKFLLSLRKQCWIFYKLKHPTFLQYFQPHQCSRASGECDAIIFLWPQVKSDLITQWLYHTKIITVMYTRKDLILFTCCYFSCLIILAFVCVRIRTPIAILHTCSIYRFISIAVAVKWDLRAFYPTIPPPFVHKI